MAKVSHQYRSPPEKRGQFTDLQEKVRQECHVAKTVCCTASIQLVTLPGKFEGILRPGKVLAYFV